MLSIKIKWHINKNIVNLGKNIDNFLKYKPGMNALSK